MATTAAPPILQIVLDLDTLERVVLRPPEGFSDDDFFDFCRRKQYELFRIERNAEGDIIIMPPVGFDGALAESAVFIELHKWAKRDRRGLAVPPNTGIKFPDGSTFAPDGCWIPNEIRNAIPRGQRKKFAPFVPPFVIEVRSPSDRKKDLHEKMLTYLRNGVELGWLIDPLSRTVRIYKQGEEFVELNDPERVEGEGPVAGFVLDLKHIYGELDL